MVQISVAFTTGQQLIEATGPVEVIYVVIERGQERFLMRGGVYSHYEFAWPRQETLTTAQWQELLAAKDPPARPVWVTGFIVME